MTLHFTQTYSSLWFPFGKPRLGWAAPATVVTVAVQPFCVIKYSPLFCPPQAASLPAKPVISVFYREDGRGCVYMPVLDRKNASVLGKRTSHSEEVRLVPYAFVRVKTRPKAAYIHIHADLHGRKKDYTSIAANVVSRSYLFFLKSPFFFFSGTTIFPPLTDLIPTI